MMPTFVTFGITFCNNSTCFEIGDISLVPVAIPPGFFIESTNFADTGSVTAVNKTGTSVDRLAKVCAAGVAIPKTRSLLAIKLVEMVCKFDWSPCAFS